MAVDGGHDDVGVVVEKRDDLFRVDPFGNARIAAQIALPQHRADLLGDAAHDPSAHDPPPGVPPEIGLRHGFCHAGECRRLDREIEKQCEPFQCGGGSLVKAVRGVCRPTRVDAIHFADHAGIGKAVNERQVIRHAFVARLRDRRKIGRLAGSKAASQRLLAGLQQIKERAAPPIIGRLARARAPVIHRFEGVRSIGAPAKNAPLIYRVQRVENDHRAGQRNAGLDHPPTKPRHQLSLGSADQPGFGHPRAEGVDRGFVHRSAPSGSFFRGRSSDYQAAFLHLCFCKTILPALGDAPVSG